MVVAAQGGGSFNYFIHRWIGLVQPPHKIVEINLRGCEMIKRAEKKKCKSSGVEERS